jgi:hypothetical protein
MGKDRTIKVCIIATGNEPTTFAKINAPAEDKPVYRIVVWTVILARDLSYLVIIIGIYALIVMKNHDDVFCALLYDRYITTN